MAALALLRLFVIAVLIYIAFYLIFGKKKKKKLEEGRPEKKESVSDVLKEDPVCHKLVPKGQAVRLREKGKTVYFCSEECCEKYELDKQESSD